VAAISLIGLLWVAPAALAASAIDQYSEALPTAKGENPTRKAVQGGGGTATIPLQTRSQLESSKIGAAAEKAAKLTAPSRGGSASSDTSDTGDGLGFGLPLVLAATLAAAIGIALARRRFSATPS